MAGGNQYVINIGQSPFTLLWFTNYISCLHNCLKGGKSGFGGALKLSNNDKRYSFTLKAWDLAIGETGVNVSEILKKINKGDNNDIDDLGKVFIKYLNHKFKLKLNYEISGAQN